MEECGRCKYKAHLIGLGLGVRCTHPDNQKYKLKDDNQTMPIIITRVPSICLLQDTGQKKKLILHIPHSSTYVPEAFKVSEGVSLEKEFQRMTDWYTDELFDFDEAEKLIFPYSRLYCDVERFRSDRDETMARKGMGVCYTRTSYGTKLREVSSKEKVFIKSSIYDEHHKKLELLVAEELRMQGSALIIDCHSFSNTPLPHEDSTVRPDICIGTDSFHTPIELIEHLRDYFEQKGLTVAVNEPFAGTMVPLKFYGKNGRVKSIMIEVNRKLYLDDEFKKNKNFIKMKQLFKNALKGVDVLFSKDLINPDIKLSK
jgi:N-formylglutamate amidohydrolase